MTEESTSKDKQPRIPPPPPWEGSLLLVISCNVDPEQDKTLREWWNSNLFQAMSIPGYKWAALYELLLRGDFKYHAFYRIANPSYLESLMGPDPAKRHPLARLMWDDFGKLKGLKDVNIGVYEQVSGVQLDYPLMASNRPLEIVQTDVDSDIDSDVEEEWNQWYTQSHQPNLLTVMGYELAGRFRLHQSPLLGWLHSAPKYLALYEMSNEAIFPYVADEKHMTQKALAEWQNNKDYGMLYMRNFHWDMAKIVSRHWPAATESKV